MSTDSTEPVFIPMWQRRHEPCTKRNYASQKVARREARRLSSAKGLSSTPMRPYFHRDCGTWHLTTQPMRVRAKYERGTPRRLSPWLREIELRAVHIRSMVPVVVPMHACQHAAFAASRYGQDDGGSLLLMDLEGGHPLHLECTAEGLGGVGPLLRMYPDQQRRLEALAGAVGMELGPFVVAQIFGS